MSASLPVPLRRAFLAVAILSALAGCEEEPSSQSVAASGKAVLSLDMKEFKYSFRDGRHTYTHQRVFTETGGVGVTIVRGKVCVMDGKECADALVGYRVDAGQTLEQNGHYVATPAAKDRITLHYWAEDDAGNKFEFEKIIRTDGESAVSE